MLIVELIPLNKGNQIILDNNVITTIGRTKNINCIDNKVSRNHAQLFVKSDETVWIKSIHHNPIFYKTKTNKLVTLTKDKEYQLYNDDEFGLLPDEYFYRLSIKTINSSTIPKSPIKDDEILTIENHEIEKLESENNNNLNKTRTLPTWISDTSISTSEHDERPINTPSVRARIHPEAKRTKVIVYNDDDDDDDNNKNDESNTVTSSTERASTSNDIDQPSSTVVHSTKREQCPYGASCYRKNQAHRQEFIHPGDADWGIKENDKNKTKPQCPYGNECYRKNSEHFNEYYHPKKRVIEIKTKQHRKKRKLDEDDLDDDDEDDDDDLPNEYDYNDSFIDDEDLGSTTIENEDSVRSDGDTEWKPEKYAVDSDQTDDNSLDDSQIDLVKEEANEFIKDSKTKHYGSKNKKPRTDDEDDD